MTALVRKLSTQMILADEIGTTSRRSDYIRVDLGNWQFGAKAVI